LDSSVCRSRRQRHARNPQIGERPVRKATAASKVFRAGYALVEEERVMDERLLVLRRSSIFIAERKLSDIPGQLPTVDKRPGREGRFRRQRVRTVVATCGSPSHQARPGSCATAQAAAPRGRRKIAIPQRLRDVIAAGPAN